jgi:hypothetical protein
MRCGGHPDLMIEGKTLPAGEYDLDRYSPRYENSVPVRSKKPEFHGFLLCSLKPHSLKQVVQSCRDAKIQPVEIADSVV